MLPTITISDAARTKCCKPLQFQMSRKLNVANHCNFRRRENQMLQIITISDVAKIKCCKPLQFQMSRELNAANHYNFRCREN